MKINRKKSKITFLVLICINCSLFSQPVLPDSLITIDNIYNYSLTQPEKAQLIIDILRERNDEKLAYKYEIDWAQADFYYNNSKFRQATYYYENLINDEEVKNKPDRMMIVLSTMMEAYLMNNENEKAMQTAIKLQEIAEISENSMETGRAYFIMAKVCFNQKEIDDALRYFNLAEEYLTKEDNVPYLFYFYTSLANIWSSDREPIRALEAINKAEELFQEMPPQPDMPEGYQEYEQGRLYALKAEILAINGKQNEAESYYKAFSSLPFSTNISNKIHIVPYLLAADKYQKAIEISKQREIFLRDNTDTIGTDMLAVKHYLATSYENLGMHNISNTYLKQMHSISNKLRVREKESAAQELAVIYETQKKDKTIRENEIQIKQQRTILISILLIILIIITVFIGVLKNHKKTILKNTIMAKQIKELQELKFSKKEEKKKKTEKILYDKLQCLMINEKIYHNPTLTRDEVAEQLSITKTTMIQLLQSNNINSFTEYINLFRLQESISLMEQSKNRSLEQIAMKVGFGSVRTFQRQFKENFGMSPVEYRKASYINEKMRRQN